jgi:hypothetical protein
MTVMMMRGTTWPPPNEWTWGQDGGTRMRRGPKWCVLSFGPQVSFFSRFSSFNLVLLLLSTGFISQWHTNVPAPPLEDCRTTMGRICTQRGPNDIYCHLGMRSLMSTAWDSLFRLPKCWTCDIPYPFWWCHGYSRLFESPATEDRSSWETTTKLSFVSIFTFFFHN